MSSPRSTDISHQNNPGPIVDKQNFRACVFRRLRSSPARQPPVSTGVNNDVRQPRTINLFFFFSVMAASTSLFSLQQTTKAGTPITDAQNEKNNHNSYQGRKCMGRHYQYIELANELPAASGRGIKIVLRPKGRGIRPKLRNKLEQDIIAGRYRAGEKLPSLRKLHSETGRSISTINQAYMELEHRGMVSTRNGSEKSLKNMTCVRPCSIPIFTINWDMPWTCIHQ